MTDFFISDPQQYPPAQAAIPIVQEAWEAQQQNATNVLASANALAAQLNSLAGQLAGLSLEFPTPTPPDLGAGTFSRPASPALSDPGSVSADIPAVPDTGDVTLSDAVAMPDAPDFGGLAYSKPTPPAAAPPTRPANLDVQLVEPTLPAEPSFNMPAEPMLLTVNLPAQRDFTVPTFAAQRPTSTLVAPSNQFSWTYEPYSSDMLDTIKGRLSTIMVDGVSLPAAIEAQLFGQMRDREDSLSLKAERQTTNELASRKLRQPAGVLVRRLEQIRSENRQTTSAANRELTVQNAKMRVDTIMQALSQGTQLELALLQSKMEENRLKLDAAKAVQQIAIELFNAAVALHNADVETYKAEVQVYESRIRAMAAEVDAYGKEIEAAKLVGDYNESMARVYSEKVRAVLTVAEIYGKRVEAAKVVGELNVQKLEQVRLTLQAYGLDIDAWGKGWDAFGKQVEAEANGARVFEIMAGIYDTRVRAALGQEQAANQRVQSQIAIKRAALDEYLASLEGVKTDVQAQIAAVNARTEIARTQATIFGAEVQASAAESEANTRAAQLRLDAYKTDAEVQMRAVEAALNMVIEKIRLAIEIAKGQAQVYSQLAASVLSGVSTSANISFGGGYNESRSSSVSWAGEAADWGGGLIS